MTSESINSTHSAELIRRVDKGRHTGITRDCHGTPILNEAKADEVSGFTAVCWVDALPSSDDKLNALIRRGYAVGTSGPRRPQEWTFFADLPPALAYGRSARMSQSITGYGVYEAATEGRHHRVDGDQRYLWLLEGASLDREPDETEQLQTWLSGIDSDSAQWSPELAGLPAVEDQTETLASRHLNVDTEQIAPAYRKLPDGRSTADALNQMLAELRHRCDAITPTEEPKWSGAVSLEASNGETWGHMYLDALGYCGDKIPTEIAEHLHRITWHAGGRMWAMGFEGSISGGEGACTCWTAFYPREDAAAVLLASLTLVLTDEAAVAEWYLSSTCKGMCSLHEDKSVPVCPTRWCGFAAADSECTCLCGGANHAKGTQGIPAGSVELDWASIPVEHIPGGSNT